MMNQCDVALIRIDYINNCELLFLMKYVVSLELLFNTIGQLNYHYQFLFHTQIHKCRCVKLRIIDNKVISIVGSYKTNKKSVNSIVV